MFFISYASPQALPGSSTGGMILLLLLFVILIFWIKRINNKSKRINSDKIFIDELDMTLQTELKIIAESEALLDKVSEKLAPFKDQKMVFEIFPKLKGIDFSNVKFGVSGNSATEMFASDIDGSWYYTTSQMAMLFKAFSKKEIDKELVKLLDYNEIKLEDEIQKNGFRAWKGNGFQIEHTLIDGFDIIIITNEDVAPVDSDKLKTTSLAPEVDLPDGYENIGIKNIYDGDKFLKANHGKFLQNIPLLFKDPEDDLNYILIRITTLTLARKIIDDIIDKNYGKTHFTKLENRDGYEYMFHNKFFSIGFMTKNFFVRINMLHNLVSLSKSELEDYKENTNDE